MTFYEWLMTKVETNTPTGDLAKDASVDKKFPREVTTAMELDKYLESRGACNGARQAGKRAMRAWKSSRKGDDK